MTVAMEQLAVRLQRIHQGFVESSIIQLHFALTPEAQCGGRGIRESEDAGTRV